MSAANMDGLERIDGLEGISAEGSSESATRCGRTVVVDVCAAYNRDELPMPKPNGPNGRRVLNIEMLMNHSFYWDWLTDREAEEVLMELYIVRTRHAQ